MNIKIFLFVSTLLSSFISWGAWSNAENYDLEFSWSVGYMNPSFSSNMLNYGGNYDSILSNITLAGEKVTQVNLLEQFPNYTDNHITIDFNLKIHLTPTFFLGGRALYIPKLFSSNSQEVAGILDAKNTKTVYMESERTTTLNSKLYAFQTTISYAPNRLSYTLGLGLGILDSHLTQSYEDEYKQNGAKWSAVKDKVHNKMGPTPLNMYNQNHTLGALLSLGMNIHLFSWNALDFNAFANEDVYWGFHSMLLQTVYLNGGKIISTNTGNPIITMTSAGINLGLNFF